MRWLLLLLVFATVVFVGRVEAATLPKSPVFPPFQQDKALQEEGLTTADLKKIEAGEIIVKSRPVPPGKKGAHVMAAGLVRGTTEQVFAVVMDCHGQPSYTPHLVICQNTYPDGVDPAKADEYDQYQKLKFGFSFVSKEVTYTNRMFALRPYVSAWVLKEGDIADSVGYWRVIPYKQGAQILVYVVYNDPGIAVPGWVQEILIKQDLPGTVKAFRNRVEQLNGTRK